MENKNENTEVDLRDYLKLIFAEKWLVSGVFLTAIIMAVIYNFLTPKIYEINAWLEIGKTKEGALIENPAQIIQKMKIGIYGEYPCDITVLNSDQTDLIQIKIKSANPEEAKKDMEKIFALILADHERKIETKKEAIQNEIQRLQTKINLLEQEKKILAAKMEIPISQFDLFFLKDSLLEKNQNIEDLYSKIDPLKDSLGDIQSTKMVNNPVIPNTPIKPKSRTNIMIAGLLGLFFGIFVVFGKKWLKELKS